MITDKSLDSLFRLCIKKRDTYLDCPLCGLPFNFLRPAEVCHFAKRRYTKTRWSLDNGILACQICNHLDRSIEIELVKRGVDTEKVLRTAHSFGKVDKFAVRQELMEYLKS